MFKAKLAFPILSLAALILFQCSLNGQPGATAAGPDATSTATPSPSPTPTPDYRVIYTGRLYGYFRYPAVQTIANSGEEACPAEVPVDKVDENDPESKKLKDRLAPEAAAFRKQREKLDEKDKNSILVSVGDNFAPFLLSRRVWIDNSDRNPYQGHGSKREVEDFKDFERDKNSLAAKEDHLDLLHRDNVACFLRLAHFDAVVPGMHDFYFGQDHLQTLAKFLYRPATACPKDDKTACYEPVRMLAGNLSLKAERTDSQQLGRTGGGDSAPGVRSWAPDTKPGVVLPKVVLPWMSAIRIQNAEEGSFFLCQYGLGTADSEVEKDACKAKAKARIELKEEPPAGLPRAKAGIYAKDYYWMSGSRALHDTFLQPNFVYGVFEKQKGFLKSFKVALPFFYQSQDREAWELVERGGKKIAIFGVVDPEIAQFIGQLNYTWLGLKHKHVDDSYVTVVDASDAAEALNQILQSCYYDQDCRDARKVLLAQMAQGKLQETVLPLLHLPPGTTPFDLAISSVDPNSATGKRTTILEQPEDTILEATSVPGRDPLQRSTVVVPGSHFDPKDAYKVHVRLQEAQITSSNSSRRVYNQVHLGKEITSNPFNHFDPPLNALLDDDKGKPDLLVQSIARAVRGNPPFNPGSKTDEVQEWRDALERAGLDTMHDKCDADIAMLQHRDIFFDQSVLDAIKSKKFSDAGVKAVINLILWKGDFIQCVNVTGQTLSSVLQRSSDLQRAEDGGQATELSLGWPLSYTGISPAKKVDSGKSQWLVHGEYLDPKRLYSVALTDYLANGDTGYPDLQNAQPEPQIKLADLELRRFTDHLLFRLLDAQEKTFAMRKVLPNLDNAENLPAKEKNVFQAWFQSWFKTEIVNSKLSPKEGFDFAEQQLPTTFLRLYKLDFNYALFQHNVNEAALGSQFPGVTAVDLSNPDSENFSIDWQLRWQYDSKTWAYYAETDANFGRRNQRKQTGPYQPSQSADVWFLETGPALRLFPRHQNPSGLKFIFPMSVKSQLVPPYTQITPIQAKSSGGPTTPITAPINFYLAFRPGLRFEHNFPRPQNSGFGGGGGSSGSSSTASGGGGKGKGGGSQQGGGQGQSQSSTINSYFEGGFEAGEVFRSPSAFQFNNPGTTVFPCSTGLIPVDDLVQCVNVMGPNAVLKHVIGDRSFYQQGVYLNARIDVPLPIRSLGEYIMENRGDFFFKRSSDAPVDVRLLDNWKHSLQFPIFSKISVGPSVEFVFFRTKVTGNYYFSYSTSVSLNYNFDWHSGLSWPKALGFGSSLPAPNPLPTK